MKYILIIGIILAVYCFVRMYRQIKRDVKALRLKRVRAEMRSVINETLDRR